MNKKYKKNNCILATSAIAGGIVCGVLIREEDKKNNNYKNIDELTAAVSQYDLDNLDGELLGADFLTNPKTVWDSNPQAASDMIINRISALKATLPSGVWHNLPSINDLAITSIANNTVIIKSLTNLQYKNIGEPVFNVSTKQTLNSKFQNEGFDRMNTQFDYVPTGEEILYAIYTDSQNKPSLNFRPNQAQVLTIEPIIEPKNEFNYSATIAGAAWSNIYSTTGPIVMSFKVNGISQPYIDLNDYIQNTGVFSISQATAPVDIPNVLAQKVYDANIATIGSAFSSSNIKVTGVMQPDPKDGTAVVSVDLDVFKNQTINIRWVYTPRFEISNYITNTQLGHYTTTPTNMEIIAKLMELNPSAPSNIWNQISVVNVSTNTDTGSVDFGNGEALIEANADSENYIGFSTCPYTVGFVSLSGPETVKAIENGLFIDPIDPVFNGSKNVDGVIKNVNYDGSFALNPVHDGPIPATLQITDGGKLKAGAMEVGSYNLEVIFTYVPTGEKYSRQFTLIVE